MTDRGVALVAGSVTIGHHVTLAGQVGVAGHLKIGDNVTVGGKAGITADVPDQSTMMGLPAMPVARGRRVWLLQTQLPELVERIKRLESQVEELAAEDEGDGTRVTSQESTGRGNSPS